MQLEVNTKHRNGGAGKGNQDVVHRKGHHAANGVHGNGGDAHRVNALDGGPRRAEAFQRQVNVLIAQQVHYQPGSCADPLPGYGSHSSTGCFHAGHAEQTEDEDGIQRNVDQSANQLAGHGERTAPGGDQQFSSMHCRNKPMHHNVQMER